VHTLDLHTELGFLLNLTRFGFALRRSLHYSLRTSCLLAVGPQLSLALHDWHAGDEQCCLPEVSTDSE
jgi:hypothetical protein